MRQESKPATPELPSATQGFSPGNSAAALSEILEDLGRQFGGRQPGRVLILAPGNLAPILSTARDWVIHRYPASAASVAEHTGKTGSTDAPIGPAMLPFADEAFDTICLCSVVSMLAERPELAPEICRVLKSRGVVVAIEPVANFNFAPLPAGGPAQLIRRYLLDVGLRHVHPLASPQGLLAFAAAPSEET